MSERTPSGLLAHVSPELERILNRGDLSPPRFDPAHISCQSVLVEMRDGVRLATDLFLPPEQPAPVVAVRTPYGRGTDDHGFLAALMALARRGYAVVSQDCRGTGASEPDHWDYYLYESQDSLDLIGWITQRAWFGGFIGSCGGSYLGQTQWCMAQHSAVTAIVPQMSGLGLAHHTGRLYLFVSAYARSVGKGEGKLAVPYYELERLLLPETLAGGYFNEPLSTPLPEVVLSMLPQLRALTLCDARGRLWEYYCAMSCAERASFLKRTLGRPYITSADIEKLPTLFGQKVAHDAHTIPHVSPHELCQAIQAPALLRTGWYDWGLNDALATWETLRRQAQPAVARRTRLIITPFAHNAPGYHEGIDTHPELIRPSSLLTQVALLLRWYEAVRDDQCETWPTVIYYLMGANEWRTASDWPVPETSEAHFYLGSEATLTRQPPRAQSCRLAYTYDPGHPTPTLGGSIVSFVYPPGSVDVSSLQERDDVLVFSTAPLDEDLDVVGPVRMILFASSSAIDTDFVARLSDVGPDGRAIQLQCGLLRARFRAEEGEPQLLEPGRIYRFEIDLWATANRFKAGHRLRVDISSADFPRFDRNSNRGGEPGDPIVARQTVCMDAEHPSHLVVSVLNRTKP